MKVLFFGSSDFSVSFLDAIYNSRHTVTLAVTNVDRKKGRGKKIASNPVKTEAARLGIPYYELDNFGDDFYDFIKNISFETIITVSFGKILPPGLLDASDKKTINVHPSILPNYRGSSPIITALLNGDKETGVSLIKIDQRVDSGDVYRIEKIPILEEDNRDSLEEKIIFKGRSMLIELLDAFSKGKVKTYPQSQVGISYTRFFKKEDTVINWKIPAIEIFNKVRAFSSSPGCETTIGGKKIKILKARHLEYDITGMIHTYKQGEMLEFKPGEVVRADNGGLIVYCGNRKKYSIYASNSFLGIEIIKPQNKNSMNYKDFLNGYKIKTGEFFE